MPCFDAGFILIDCFTGYQRLLWKQSKIKSKFLPKVIGLLAWEALPNPSQLYSLSPQEGFKKFSFTYLNFIYHEVLNKMPCVMLK